jgi:hypothetical protein
MSRVPARWRPHALLAAATLALAACDIPNGPRQLPFPSFDARAPFPELVAGRVATKPKAGTSALQKALAAAQGPDPQTVSTPQSWQPVLLAGGFIAEIPKTDYDDWRWASDGAATLVIHAAPGNPPDALVYSEPFSELAYGLPSLELIRFQLTVDPAVTCLPELVERWSDAFGSSSGDRPGNAPVAQAMWMLATRTLGVGLGYRSAPKSFSGWRWVGKNGQGVEVRAARTLGRWGAPDDLDTNVLNTLDALASRDPGLTPLSERMAGELGRASVRRQDLLTRESYMVMASLSQGAARRVHVALLCAKNPQCLVASELRAMLDSVRAPRGDELARLSGQTNAAALQALANETGIVLSSAPLGSLAGELARVWAAPDREPPADPASTPVPDPGTLPLPDPSALPWVNPSTPPLAPVPLPADP